MTRRGYLHLGLGAGVLGLLLVSAPGDLAVTRASSSTPASTEVEAAKAAAAKAVASAPSIADSHLSVVVNQATRRVWVVSKDDQTSAVSVVGTSVVDAAHSSASSNQPATYTAKYDPASHTVTVMDPTSSTVVANVHVNSATTQAAFSPATSSPPPSPSITNAVPNHLPGTMDNVPPTWPH